jgi:hypothetical protein
MEMDKAWKTPGESYIDFALALKELETQLYKMGGRMGNIEEVSYSPDGYIGAKIGVGFSGPELREYISRLPPPVSDSSQG